MKSFLKNNLGYLNILQHRNRYIFLFSIGLSTYLFIQVGLFQVIPQLNSSFTHEADDVYSYINKASQMESCFLQNCPALEDLSPQLLAPSKIYNVAGQRSRQHHRILNVYHPLQSLILLCLHSLGVSWETAYRLIEVFGSVFIGGAISYFLFSIWGYPVAGITLTLLSFFRFNNQGIHYIVPSNLALGIALLTWGIITHHQDQSSRHWLILPGILAMGTMHPVGRVYGFITIIIYLLITRRTISRRTIMICSVGLLLIIFFFTLPLVVSRPQLLFLPEPYPPDWSAWSGYISNLKAAIHTVKSFLGVFGGIVSFAVLLLVGFISASSQQKERVIVLGGVLGLLLLGSLLHLLPKYPAELFRRVWIPMALLIFGVIGQAIWCWFSLLVLKFPQILSKAQAKLISSRWILSPQAWTIVLVIFITLSMSHSLLVYANHRIPPVIRTITKVKLEKQNVSLDPSQPTSLLSPPHSCKRVLYLNETRLYFYLTYGAWKCGAIFYPAIAGTSEEAVWLDKNNEISHVVGKTPIRKLPVNRGKYVIPLSSEEGVEFLGFKEQSLNSLYFYLENFDESALLNFSLVSDDTSKLKQLSVKIPAQWTGWLQVSDRNISFTGKLILESVESQIPIYMSGLRLNSHSQLNWPWDEGVRLIYAPLNGEVKIINFDSTEISPVLKRPLRVIADGGNSILTELQ